MKRLILLGLALLSAGSLQGQDRTRSPHGKLEVECKACHGPNGWTPVRITKAFDHGKFGFPLAAAHQTAACRACHQTLDFKGVKSDCVSCHADRHRGELGANCARCHTARSFLDRDVMTKAHQLTRFPLAGSHLGVDCSGCHRPGAQGSMQFVGTRTDCVACHQTDYQTAPNHVASRFPTTCATCHNMVAWGQANITDHPTTPIALTGVHSGRQCNDCHTSMPYSSVKQTCDGCHHQDFVAATAPNHVAAGFDPLKCNTCHQPVAGWAGAQFNHPTTPVSLAGAHAVPTCTDCHTTAPYSTVKSTCDGCHHTDYVGTSNPNHTAAGYPTDCASCHAVVANWAGANVNHPTNPIALTGVHANRQCSDCHLAGQAFAAVKQTCDGCHHTDFVGAREPDHVAAQFAVTCTDCHALVPGWIGATYANHSTSPINPKQGAHAAVLCTQCHTRSPYSSAPTTCDGCHHADYAGATNPTHTPANFALTCSDCHQIVAGWTGATFSSHPSAPLALTGQHALTLRSCTDCHTTSAYASVAQTCDGCHHTTYIGVTDPNHTAVGMAAFAAANCSNCHSPTKSVWTGPTWTHMTIVRPQSVRLPHQGASCADCHQVATDYTVKSCARSGCHRNVNGP